MERRTFLQTSAMGTLAAMTTGVSGAAEAQATGLAGSQRLSLEALRVWEGLGYGMFIHFGMSTFVSNELPSGQDAAALYAPDQLDVEQWVKVARDAGMKYAVLTAKHVAGHCLWPSKLSDYTVAQSTNTVDVMGAFVAACRTHGVLPGFYYCSWDNHHRFGSKTPSDKEGELPAHTTSLYQNFQTAQITEIMQTYGPFAEVWVDIPGVLGRGYRTFLYEHIAGLQPDTVIMMNSGISSGETYNVDYAWPSDLIAIERSLPPEGGHSTWREIEGKQYYLAGEVCDPIGKEWFWVDGDAPRPVEQLAAQWEACHARGVNLLLDVPPDKHGLLPAETVTRLMDLRKAVKL